jgi:hypothetical protein
MALRVRQEGWQGSLGGNVNQLANSERNISIGAPQPKGCRSRSTSATSRSLRLFAGNFSSRMWSIHWRTHSARFAEIRIASLVDDVPRRIPVCLTEADSFPSTWRTAIPPSPWFARGRSFPPGTGRPSSGPLGNGAGSDGHGALESTSVGSPVVERMEIR